MLPAILDAEGNVVVSYVYDAWGQPIGKAGTLASTLGTLNPFRYRGYVYDEETGLYYLRSRYYNYFKSRFLNSDDFLFEKNLYTYCINIPTNRVDVDGNFSFCCIEEGVNEALHQVLGDNMGAGGYHVDFSMAVNSSMWRSPLLNGEWSGYYVQTSTTYNLDHVTLSETSVIHHKNLNTASESNTSQKYNPEQISQGWHVGENIFNTTATGAQPSWSTIRARWWKNEFATNYSYYAENNRFRCVENMQRGLAPIEKDNYPSELHHPFGREGSYYYVFLPIERTKHIDIHRSKEKDYE